jgi:DNA-3-methyladenine glycosylase II
MRARYEVVPRRPFSLARTAARLARFPELVDRFHEGKYQRLVSVNSVPVLMSVTQQGPASRARLGVTLVGERARVSQAKREAGIVLDRVLGVSTDVRPFYRSFGNDPLLGPLIRKHSGLRIAGRVSVWETLIQIVLSQQINLAFAHGILADLVKSYGLRKRFDGETYYLPPTPRRIAKLSEADLRGHRLSGSKARTLIGLANAFEAGDISEAMFDTMDDEHAVEFLSSFKGIGRWTAEFTLLRGLSRLDVFPAGDLGVVKYLPQKLLGRDHAASEDEMREFAIRWRPFRGLALIYAYAELG